MPELKKVLVTGATGFVGRFVQKSWNDALPWPKGADLTQPDQVTRVVEKLVQEHPFDAVLHLAAQANPSLSKVQVQQTWSLNLMGTVHLTEALSKAEWQGRFLYVSTGAVYGKVQGDIDETTPVVVSSPYVASKLAAESAVLEWGRRTGASTTVVRPFNHSGPGQDTHYFLSSMAQQLAELPLSGGVVEVGNLAVQRDFLYVGDVVNAYRALLEQGRSQHIYNLASGVSLPLRQLLDRLAQRSGRPVEFRVSPQRFRPESSEPMRICTAKLKDHTNWQIEYGLDRLLDELMEDWKERTCQRQH
jgi:GDP-4-dehydro-6-deoxy-D-mannose reductase